MTPASLPGRLAERAWVLPATAAVLAALLATGYAAGLGAGYALALAAGLGLVGLTFVNRAAIPAAAVPALVVTERVGGDALNLSVSDAALAAAFGAALVLAPRPFSRPMRALLWLSATYQAATLFTVVVNRYAANTVEWFHAWLLVAGALVVGWAVGRAGLGRVGLGLFVGAGVVLAAATLGAALLTFLGTGAFQPVYVLGMHKNALGTVLGFAAVVVYCRPTWLGWSPRWTLPLFALLGLATLATQSRQALLGLGAALLVVALRRDPDRRRSRLIVLAIAGAGVMVTRMVEDQLAQGDAFNSTYQRLSWYEDTLALWREVPWFGAGLRYWVTGRTDLAFQPPNAELEVLASAGVVGLVGFVVLLLGSLVVLWRVDPRFGTLAVATLVARVVQAQLDLFWVAVQASLPFLVVGICLGAAAAGASPPTTADPAARAPASERVVR